VVRTRILLPLLLFLYIPPAYTIQLQDLEWQSRPLLIFAPDYSDSRWLTMRNQLNQYSCDLDDRNLVLGIIYTKGESTISGQLISENYNRELRQQFHIAEQDFIVILLGKDGKERYRTHEVPVLANLFSLIDQMPMRRIETKQQPPICQ